MQTRTAQILVSLLFLTTAISSCDKKEVSPWNQMTEVNNQIVPPVFPERSFVITDYHDVKDTLYTNAINRAITICSEQGGGKVIIPDGEFLTAPIRLKSNVNLHLSDSTVLKFTTDPFFFDLVQTRIEGIDCYNISPLIYAYGETNIAITGNGVMDGQADSSNWFSENRIRGIVQEDGKKINEKTLLYEMKEDSIPFKERVFMRENGIRPQFINLYKCKNILLEGFTLNRSPFWLIHPLLSENITVRKVKMQSHGYKSDEIISTGYNGAPRGRANCVDLGYCSREAMQVPRGERYELCRSVHAEANAIISASRNECIGGDIYLVGHDAKTGAILSDATSCSMCRRMIINAGIKRVVVRNSKQDFTIVPVQDWIDQDDTLEL